MTRVRTAAGTSVAVRLDNENPTYYCDLPDENVHCHPTVDNLTVSSRLSTPHIHRLLKGG